jgi:hypothetical protein
MAPLSVTITVSGVQSVHGSLETNLERKFQLGMRSPFTPADIGDIQRVCTTLADLPEEQHQKFAELLNAIGKNGDTDKARQMLEELGLTAKDGIDWAEVVFVLACIFIA